MYSFCSSPLKHVEADRSSTTGSTLAVDGQHLVDHRGASKSDCCAARRDSTHPAQSHILPGLGNGETLLLRIHSIGRLADIPEALPVLRECSLLRPLSDCLSGLCAPFIDGKVTSLS